MIPAPNGFDTWDAFLEANGLEWGTHLQFSDGVHETLWCVGAPILDPSPAGPTEAELSLMSILSDAGITPSAPSFIKRCPETYNLVVWFSLPYLLKEY